MLKEEVNILPSTGIVMISVDGKPYLVLVHEKGKDTLAVSISIKNVLKNLIKDGFITITNNKEKPKCDRLMVT